MPPKSKDLPPSQAPLRLATFDLPSALTSPLLVSPDRRDGATATQSTDSDNERAAESPSGAQATSRAAEEGLDVPNGDGGSSGIGHYAARSVAHTQSYDTGDGGVVVEAGWEAYPLPVPLQTPLPSSTTILISSPSPSPASESRGTKPLESWRPLGSAAEASSSSPASNVAGPSTSVALDSEAESRIDDGRYACPYKSCHTTWSSINSLKLHLQQVHNEGKGRNSFECPVPNCDYVAHAKGNLVRHKRDVHSIGNRLLWPCKQPGCTYVAKRAYHLKEHEAYIHNINVVWHYCDQCSYKAKQRSNLVKHERSIHGKP